MARAQRIYTVSSLAGETVRVTMNSSWINVAVGLGYSRSWMRARSTSP